VARHRGWFEFVLLAVEPYLPDVTRRLMFVRGRGLREREGGRERERWGECGLAGMDGMARIEGRGKTAVFSCVWLTARLHWCATPHPPPNPPPNPPTQSPYIQTLLQTCGSWLLGYSVSFGKIVWNASAWIRENSFSFEKES
jgi:hypothetical protein